MNPTTFRSCVATWCGPLVLAATIAAQTPPAALPPRQSPTENSVTLLGITSGAVDTAAGRYLDANGRPISPNAPNTAAVAPDSAARTAATSAPTAGTSAATKRYFADLVKAQPNSPEAWMGLARSHNFDGEIGEAIAAYERLQKLAPNTPNLNGWLAELYVAKNDWSTARGAAEGEIAAQPNSGWAHSWLGSVEYESGNAQKALAAFKRAAQLDPNAAAHRYQNAVWLGSYNQPRRALVDFIAASLMNPQFAAAYFGMANCYAKLDFVPAAIRYYEHYLKLDGSSEWAARARAELARLRGGGAVAPVSAGPLPLTPAITEFQLLDATHDRVGRHGYGTPDGQPDGRFRLGLALPAGSELLGVKLSSADASGAPGQHVWNSQPMGNWMIGVFREGAQINPTHAVTLGRMEGRLALELFMADVGVFKAGENFLIEVTLGNGTVLRNSLRGAAAGR